MGNWVLLWLAFWRTTS